MNDFHFLSQESCMTGAFACFQSGLRTCFAITYYQLPEDAYSILGFSEQRLSEELKDWTYYNGYSQAVSATFYSDMTIDFNLGSYVMQCVLDDPDQTVITVEYLKKRDKITFHL